MPDAQQLKRFSEGKGFIAALDQSGGSTPKALRAYGVEESEYSGEDEMFDLIHEARSRIITSPAFTSDRVLGAILFEGTLERQIDGEDAVSYLGDRLGVIPFLKIDKGLADEADGVQLMKEIPGLPERLAQARSRGVFGTKERSVIHEANPKGIAEVVAQQFDVARVVLDADMVPILEPEISIKAADKAEAESLLKSEILKHLDELGDEQVGIKITIPEEAGFYSELIEHPKVARMVALSGGYDRDEANKRLAANPGLIASFSRALLDGLTREQSDEELTENLDRTIEGIYEASIT